MSKIYYIYSLTNPETLQPFYIGYALRPNRPYDHIKEAKNFSGKPKKTQNGLKLNKIKKILELGGQPIIEHLYCSKSKSDILEKEILFIKQFGRLDIKTGILTNLTDGGEGGGSRTYSVEERKKKSEYKLGKTFDEQFGSEKSKIIRKKISESRKGPTGKPSWNTGLTKETSEALMRISKSNTGRKLSEERKTQLSMSMKGENNHFFGKKHSEESLKKMKESQSKYPKNGVNNPNYGKVGAATGRSWYINERDETLYLPKDSIVPEGYQKGRKWKNIDHILDFGVIQARCP